MAGPAGDMGEMESESADEEKAEGSTEDSEDKQMSRAAKIKTNFAHTRGDKKGKKKFPFSKGMKK